MSEGGGAAGDNSSAGSGVTGSVSNGVSGGYTGSSAGMMMSIPWCSEAGWNLGRCFGNQDGSQSADGKTEGGVERKYSNEQLDAADTLRLKI